MPPRYPLVVISLAREGVARLAARARRWCSTAPRFDNCGEGPGLTTVCHFYARARGAALLAARARRWCSTAPRFDNCGEGPALNDQQKCRPVILLLSSPSRARGWRGWRRELGGGVRQHPGSTTAVRGLCRALAPTFRAGLYPLARTAPRRRQQIDPLAPAAGRRRRFCFLANSGSGRRWQQRLTKPTRAATRRHRCRSRTVATDCIWFRSSPESVSGGGGTERSAERAPG